MSEEFSNENSWEVLSCDAVYSAVQGGSTFEFVDQILRKDNLNESYWAVLSCGAAYYAVQDDSNFWACGWNPEVWPFNDRLLRTLCWCCSFHNLHLKQLTFEHILQFLIQFFVASFWHPRNMIEPGLNLRIDIRAVFNWVHFNKPKLRQQL